MGRPAIFVFRVGGMPLFESYRRRLCRAVLGLLVELVSIVVGCRETGLLIALVLPFIPAPIYSPSTVRPGS